MKKSIALLLCVAMVASMAGCGESDKSRKSADIEQDTTSVTVATASEETTAVPEVTTTAQVTTVTTVNTKETKATTTKKKTKATTAKPQETNQAEQETYTEIVHNYENEVAPVATTQPANAVTTTTTTKQTQPKETKATTTEAVTTTVTTKPADPAAYIKDNVTITLTDVTPSGGTVHVSNPTKYAAEYGSEFHLEEWKNGQWEYMEMPENICFCLVAYSHPGDFDESINWGDFYGELSAGTYRLVKSYSFYYGDGCSIYDPHVSIKVDGEFTIE